MSFRHREEIVGKRFLSVSTQDKLKLTKLTDWDWRSGIVRATSHRDPKHPELSVLIEFDDTDWKGRQWVRLYQDRKFYLFVVENTLVWTVRKEATIFGLSRKKNTYWPSLTFTPLVDTVGLSDNRLQPIEYLIDKELWFVDNAEILHYQQDVEYPSGNYDFAEIQRAIRQWTEYQDGQRILVSTPSVLVGYRVEVYRVEGTTQWYTAVIISYNDKTRELTLTDDTVLEEHFEDPCLVQMRLIGDGVVESILKGENIGITPRRRACANQAGPQAHYSTRNRTHQTRPETSLSSYCNSRGLSTPVASKKTRNRQATYLERAIAESGSSTCINTVFEKVSSPESHLLHQELSSHSSDRRKKPLGSSGNHKCSVEAEVHKKTSRHRRVLAINNSGGKDNVANKLCNAHGSKESKSPICMIQGSKNASLYNESRKKKISSEHNAVIASQSSKEHDQICYKSEYAVSDLNINFSSKIPTATISSFVNNCPDAIFTVGSKNNEINYDSEELLQNSSPYSNCVSVITQLQHSTDTLSLNSNNNTCNTPNKNINHDYLSFSDAKTAASSFFIKQGKKENSDSNAISNLNINPDTETYETVHNKCNQNNIDHDCSAALSISTAIPTDALKCEVTKLKIERKSKHPMIEKSLFRKQHIKCLIAGEEIIVVSQRKNSSTEKEEKGKGSKENSGGGGAKKGNNKDNKEGKGRQEENNDKDNKSAGRGQGGAGGNNKGGGENNKKGGDYNSADEKEDEEEEEEEVDEEEGDKYQNDDSIQKEVDDFKVGCKDKVEQYKEDNFVDPKKACGYGSGSPKDIQFSVNSQYATKSEISSTFSNSAKKYQNTCTSEHSLNIHRCKPVQIAVQCGKRIVDILLKSDGCHVFFCPPSKSQNIIAPDMSDSNDVNEVPKNLSDINSCVKSHKVSDSDSCLTDNSSSQLENTTLHNQIEISGHVANNQCEKSINVGSNTDFSRGSVKNIDYLPHMLMHPTGPSQSTAAASAAASVYSRVPTLRQHSHSPNTSASPSNIVPYSPSALLHLPSSNTSTTVVPSPSASHPSTTYMDQQTSVAHSQAYRNFMNQQPLLSHHFSGSNAPPVGLMWQQKYNNPNPWVMYEELRLEREQAIIQEREKEKARIDRDRHEEIEMLEREKSERHEKERIQKEQRQEREKMERERMERERMQRERMERDRIEQERLERERMEQERTEREKLERERSNRDRMEREERERAQRDAVQQHFDESLKLVMQKKHQLQQKNIVWNVMPGMPLIKSQSGVDRRSPTLTRLHGSHGQEYEREKAKESDKERITIMEAWRQQERWMAAVQRGEPTMSHSQSFAIIEGHHGNSEIKDLYPLPRSSSHGVHSSSHMPKSSISASPVANILPPGSISASQHKPETNFSLYGYQPFQHTYITQAQLKAREEPKTHKNMQPVIITGNKMQNSLSSVKQEKDVHCERPTTPENIRNNTPTMPRNPKHQEKVFSGQERSSPMYLPLVGSGGAFKPYEFTNNSPAPPAHQNSSSPALATRTTVSSYHHRQQEQPQNLVKVDYKANHESISIHSHHRYTHDIRQTVSTPPCTVPSSYTPPYSTSKSVSPAASTNISYSLIQQGLVPNPLYIGTSHGGLSPSSQALPKSLPSPQMGSPPISQQYSHNTSGSGISSGTPVCRSNNSGFGFLQGQNSHNYFPVVPNTNVLVSSNRLCPQEAHNRNRSFLPHGSIHRSPSPAHTYASPLVGIPPGVLNSPHHSKGQLCSPHINKNPSTPQTQTMIRVPMQQKLSDISSSPPFVDSSDVQIVPLNLQGTSYMAKRKCKVTNYKKHLKNEELLLSPQLHSQIHAISTPIHQLGSISHAALSSGSLSSQHDNRVAEASVYQDSSSKTYTAVKTTISPMLILPDVRLTAKTENQMNTTGELSAECDQIKTETPCSNLSDPSLRQPSSTPNEQITVNSGSKELVEGNKISANENISCTVTVTYATTGCISNPPKLKKAWLQRHSEFEDKVALESNKVDSHLKSNFQSPDDSKAAIDISSSKQVSDESDNKISIFNKNSDSGQLNKSLKAESVLEDDSVTSASELDDEVKQVKRKSRNNCKAVTVFGMNKKHKPCSDDENNLEEPLQSKKDNTRKRSLPPEKEIASKRRGRKTKGRNSPADDMLKKKTSKPPEKPSLAQLKKTGEAFLQDGPCCEVAPRLPKCRECRMTAHQRNKKMPNIFCRFYAYRKLRYSKNGTITGAGFSKPSDASEDDLKLWLPPVEKPPSDVEIETSKFLLTHVGDQFCDLVEMEREAQSMLASETVTITWKRVVQGVREMCDVCETTLFNFHWVCHKCGFVVCIDCYKTRKTGAMKGDEILSKDRDNFQWLFCTNKQAHEPEKLMLTQIIANKALWDVGKTLHEVRRIWNIPTYCNCNSKEGEESKNSTNGICKLMSAVTKCFSSEKDIDQVNGIPESSRKKTNKNASVNGAKQEGGMGGYSSESGGSPLSWLANVALNTTKSVKDEIIKVDPEAGSPDIHQDHGDEFVESDDEKGENFSTLRELLIRPMGKMGSKTSGTDSSSQKTLKSTLDEVISCVIEQRVRKADKKCKEKELLHFTRRHQLLHSGRDPLPIRSCMFTESSLLYPEVPHIWLGNGKILLLTEPYHSGNMQMFQEQWKRGQPVIVADVGQKLERFLWTPESFLGEFGEIRNDFFNSLSNKLIPNQPMKKFWEGFENINKRMKDEDGELMVLTLKDWPPNEEFSELMPLRYHDLVKVLPLPQYTNRDGMFNMASHLPECFVRPDLGPRLYNAYGLAESQERASINLHLDISDTVNILAYVGKYSESSSVNLDVIKSLEESGCDASMLKRGLAEENQIGAIWHVYNARDADKIRDLLNKVTDEAGIKCDPHHDPFQNKECYLDGKLRDRLNKEYGVEGYAIAQCFGDAIFIPAGSPYQVRNLQSCIKVSEDFVSPESVGHSFFLTQELRHFPGDQLNHEDKLQIKNIIYHTVKDALALLQSNNPDDLKL